MDGAGDRVIRVRRPTLDIPILYGVAIGSAHRGAVSSGHSRGRALLGIAVAAGIVIVAAVLAVFAWSDVTLASDSTALARVTVQPLGGTIERVHAFAPDGQAVPLAMDGGRLTPLKPLAPGELVSVQV